MTTAVAPAVRDHAAIAEQYARDVVEGRLLACKIVQRACARHLDDAARAAADPAFPYVFDPDAGARVARFIELLPHTKGKWAVSKPGRPASNRIRLEPWQLFIIVALFGWLIRASGLRRFRKAYIEIPRKNGKSALAAGIGLYMLCADGEQGAEVYSGATTEKQAWEVFKPARLMAMKTPELQELLGVTVAAKSLYREEDAAKFEPVIGNPGDGASPHCAIVDEFHEHDTDALWDTMRTGMGAREQPLILAITTAGADLEGPCFAMRTEVEALLAGQIDDPELFGIVYTIDAGDDWTSPIALQKANPNYGVSVFAEFLQAQIAEGMRSARRQNTVKTKHLNVWCNARDPWMNLEAWNACADPELRLEDFEGERCWDGLDLASKIDLASKARVFRRTVDGVVHYYVFSAHYVPADVANEPENKHYAGWVITKHLTATEGNVIDYATIEAGVQEDARRFDLVAVGHDPFGATQMVQRLGEGGIPCVEVPQKVSHLSEPMKEVEMLVRAGRLHHTGDPVLTWCVSNVVVKPDANENIFPRKQRKESKIDGAVALFNAMNRALYAEDSSSVYESEDLFTL